MTGSTRCLTRPSTRRQVRNAGRKPGWPGLHYSIDARYFGFLFVQGALMAALWMGLLHPWAAALAWYAVAWLAVSAANIKHNHMHRRTFRSAWANVLLDHCLGLMTGTTATSIITEHNLRHHRHSNTADDFVRASLVNFRPQWLNVLCFYPRAWYELYVRKPLDFLIWWRHQRSLFWRGLAEQLTLWGTFATLLVFDWRATLLCVALPWLHGQWWLVTFNLFQHQALDPDDPWQNSRNLVDHWSNFLFFNVGYHTAHHLRPSLHWSELPRFHRQHVAPRIDARLVADNLPDFYGDWFRRRSLPSVPPPT